MDIEESHEIIDRIEREAIKNLGIFLVIHMDPIETKDAQVLAIRKQVTEILDAVDQKVSIHDFRMVDGKEQINLISIWWCPMSTTTRRKKSCGGRWRSFSTSLIPDISV